MLSHETAGICDVLIRVVQHMGGFVMRGIHFHTAEFMEFEELLVFAHSLLGKEDWPGSSITRGFFLLFVF